MTDPKAENNTFERLRPMALLMSLVNKMPDAPTRVPAMIKRFEPSVKPEAATASPVKELSREINTGTSAPPMGKTKATPSTKESARRVQSRGVEPETRIVMINATAIRPNTALMICWPG